MLLVLFIHIFITYLHSFKYIYTIHLSVAICCGLSPSSHHLQAQREIPLMGAEPGFELGPALQQADALPTELRHTLLLLIRRRLSFRSKSVSKETDACPDLADANQCRSIWKKWTISAIILIYNIYCLYFSGPDL
jgi:hypothetical protein